MLHTDLTDYLYEKGFAGILQELAEMAAAWTECSELEDEAEGYNRLRSAIWRVAIEAEAIERQLSMTAINLSPRLESGTGPIDNDLP